PLGNIFRNIPEEEAAATVDAAWQQGIRYFDTAPLYGAGLSEVRLGRALAKRKRDEYVLSSKVGRLILDEVEPGPRHLGEKGNLFEFGRPNRMVYDYTADGTLRSIEDSLKRQASTGWTSCGFTTYRVTSTATSGSPGSRPHARGRSARSPNCARGASSRHGASA